MSKVKHILLNSVFEFIESYGAKNKNVFEIESKEKWLYLEFLLSNYSGSDHENIKIKKFCIGNSFLDDEWVSILECIIFMSAVHKNIDVHHFAALIELLMKTSRFKEKLNVSYFLQNPLLYYTLLEGPYIGEEMPENFNDDHEVTDMLEIYISKDDSQSMNAFIHQNFIQLNKEIEVKIGTIRKYKANLLSFAAFYKSQNCFTSLLLAIKKSDLDQKEIFKQAKLFAVMGGNIEAFKLLQIEDEETTNNDWIIAALTFRQLDFLKYFLRDKESVEIEVDNDEDFLCSSIAIFSLIFDSQYHVAQLNRLRESNYEKMMKIGIECGQLGFVKYLRYSFLKADVTKEMIESAGATNLDIFKFFLSYSIKEYRITSKIIKDIIDKASQCSNESVLIILQEYITFTRFEIDSNRVGFIYQGEDQIWTDFNFRTRQSPNTNIMKAIDAYFRTKNIWYLNGVKSQIRRIHQKLNEVFNDESYRTPIRKAIVDRDIDNAIEHLNDDDPDSNLTLVYAVVAEMEELVSILLTGLPEGSINLSVFEDLTLLDISILSPENPVLDLLLNEGAVVSKYSLFIYLSLEEENLETLSKILKHCTEISTSHLALSIFSNHFNTLKELLPRVQVKDPYLLCAAASINNTDVLNYLIEQGYDVNGVLPDGQNVMEFLLNSNSIQRNIIHHLILKGAKVSNDASGYSKKIAEILEEQKLIKNDLSFVENAIIKREYDIAIECMPEKSSDKKNQLCFFLIKEFIMSGDYNHLRKLMTKIGILYFKFCLLNKIPVDRAGDTLEKYLRNPSPIVHQIYFPLLFLAVQKKNMDIIKLIANSSYILEEIPTGQNALFLAATLESDECLRILFRLAGRIDNTKLPRHPKYHPIAGAVAQNRPENIRFLLKHGYSPHDIVIPMDFDMTLIHLCVNYGTVDCLREFIAVEKNLNIKDGQKITPLHYAILKDNLEMVELCEQYTNKEFVIEDTEMPIIPFAADHGRWGALEFLFERGYAPLSEKSFADTIKYCIDDQQGVEFLHRHHFLDNLDADFFDKLKRKVITGKFPLSLRRIEEIENEILCKNRNP